MEFAIIERERLIKHVDMGTGFQIITHVQLPLRGVWMQTLPS